MKIYFRVILRPLVVGTAALIALASALPATAVSSIQVGSDPFANTTSQHLTQVEPDSF